MTQKLSPQKLSRMVALYFDGYTQSQIAEKLKINQATVSLYVAKFEALAGQDDIKTAGKEYGIMNQVEADLQKFIQTIPDRLDKVKQGKYSSEKLRTYILTQLAGPALQLLKCTDCQARFAVNKWPKIRRYYCPICGFHTTVVVDQDALGILKAELSTLRQLPRGEWTKVTSVKQPETNEETKG